MCLQLSSAWLSKWASSSCTAGFFVLSLYQQKSPLVAHDEVEAQRVHVQAKRMGKIWYLFRWQYYAKSEVVCDMVRIFVVSVF